MNTLQDDLKRMSMLSGEALDNFLHEMKTKYSSAEEKRIIADYLVEELSEIKSDIAELNKELTVKEQLKDISEVVSLSYIAKKYFGKSRSWLYQRINGNKVRGHIYTLSPDEVKILNTALKDIGNKIGSLSIQC